MHARLLALGVLWPVLLPATGAARAGTPVFHGAGIVVRAPRGWFVTDRPLNGIADPVQRFALSSFRVPLDADAAGGYVPPSSGVLAQLDEEVPPLADAGAWPPRPARFRLPHLGRMETLGGDRWGELLFRDRGRHFSLFVWVGRKASSGQVHLLLCTLDGVRIAAG